MTKIRERQGEVSDTVRRVVREEAAGLQNSWLVGVGALFTGLIVITLAVTSNDRAFTFVRENGIFIGVGLLFVSVVAFFILSRRNVGISRVE